MNFILGLPIRAGFNDIYSYIKKLSKFVHLIPCFKEKGDFHTSKYTNLFFEHIFYLFDLPQIVLYDHDSCFTSNF